MRHPVRDRRDRALVPLPDQVQDISHNQTIAPLAGSQGLDQLGILALVFVDKPSGALVQLRPNHRAAGGQHPAVHAVHPLAHINVDQAGHAVFPAEGGGRQAEHVAAVKGRNHVGEQAGRDPMALVDHDLAKMFGQALEIVFGGIDDGHGDRSEVEHPVARLPGLDAQELANTRLPLVHQFLGVNQD